MKAKLLKNEVRLGKWYEKMGARRSHPPNLKVLSLESILMMCSQSWDLLRFINLRSRYSKDVRLQIHFWFWTFLYNPYHWSRYCNSQRFPSSTGIVPLTLVLERLRYLKLLRYPRKCGIWLKEFKLRSKCSSCCNSINERLIVRCLYCTPSIWGPITWLVWLHTGHLSSCNNLLDSAVVYYH